MTTVTTRRIPADTLATRLVTIRHEQGHIRSSKMLSQREAAMETGVPFGTWQGMETGRNTRGLDQHIDKICRTWGYDRAWLMWGTTTPAPGPGAAAVPSNPGYVRTLRKAA